MIAILHNIRSVYNVGSIFRTADAVGVEKIYLTGITPTPLDEVGQPRELFSKTALGAEKFISWESFARISPVIKKLKFEGYQIFALEQSPEAISIDKFCHSRPDRESISRNKKWIPACAGMTSFNKAALVLGNEIRGLPKSVLAQCDKILEIPMFGKKESLNVAVAFGIAAYYLRFFS